MRPNLRRLVFAIVVIVALFLLFTPVILRTAVWQFNERTYTPSDANTLNLAATPVPTNAPVALTTDAALQSPALRSGPVVVDLAHGNRLERAAFEPLAAALAEHGVGMRFWLSDVDLLSITSYYDFPDQSDELRPLLDEASALVVVSPFFLWSPQEIARVERFVARGGRLLLISDPDVLGDLAQDINNLAEPFGLVFNDDYLYNTQTNDGNFVHIFQEQFLDQAAPLEDATIALYGARSLGGDGTAQIRTGANVLSSMRSGVIEFATMAVGGLDGQGTAGRVLAMTDFDVLTQPYVVRHDNTQLLNFVAEFLAAGDMRQAVIDFPAYLGKEVSLVFGNARTGNTGTGQPGAVDASVLLQGARLQASLEATGRTLTLAGTASLTSTLAAELETARDPANNTDAADVADVADTNGAQDWLILADYELAEETALLADLGFSRVESMSTAAATLSATLTTAITSTPTVTVTSTVTPTLTPTIAPTITPTITPDIAPTATVTGTEPITASAQVQTTPTATASASATVTATASATPEGTGTPEITATPTLTPTLAATVTPTATITATVPLTATVTPTGTATPAAPADPITITVGVTATPTATRTVTPTATPTPEPEITVYLERDDGLRLLAAQTVLITQRELPNGARLVAILGHDAAGISAGVDRLLARDYDGCITGATLAVCSFAAGQTGAPPATPAPASDDSAATPDSTPDGTPTGPPPSVPDPMSTPVPTPAAPDAPPDAPNAQILIVDDNANAAADESSEADLYLQALTQAGYTPDLWTTAEQSAPEAAELLEYAWVIWSAGGYVGGGPDLVALDSLLAYINEGGRLTISSREPFFGMGVEDASPIADVLVDSGIPALVEGLPSDSFALAQESPPVIPLQIDDRDEGPSIALRRGPESGNPDAPLLFMVDDAGEEDATGARLMIVGLSLTWLPPEHAQTLANNMAPVMITE